MSLVPLNSRLALRTCRRLALHCARMALALWVLLSLTSYAATNGSSFAIQGVRLVGVTAFDSDALLEQLDDAAPRMGQGSMVTLSDLERLADAITRHYRQHGYSFARAYIPEQEIADGVIWIVVLEGEYDEVLIENDSRLKESVARGILGPVRADSLIESRSLTQATRLLLETPGVRAQTFLGAGATPGSATLTVHLADGPRFSGSVSLDNYGTAATGSHRVTAALNINNPTGSGDRVTLIGFATIGGINHGNIAYGRPLGNSPNRWRASYGRTQYEIQGAFAALDAVGSANVSDLRFQFPFVRQAALKLDAEVALTNRDLEDSAAGERALRQTQTLALALDGERRIEWGLGGYDRFALVVTAGRLAILDPATRAQDRATVGTAGDYAKVNASFTRNWRLGERVTVEMDLSAQWASKNLLSLEKFALGGPRGVRAYMPGTLSGDDGWLVRTELRFDTGALGALPGRLELIGSLDIGGVRRNKEEWVGAPPLNVLSLFGASAGIAYTLEPFELRADFAWPLRDHYDLGPKHGVLWITSSLRF